MADRWQPVTGSPEAAVEGKQVQPGKRGDRGQGTDGDDGCLPRERQALALMPARQASLTRPG